MSFIIYRQKYSSPKRTTIYNKKWKKKKKKKKKKNITHNSKNIYTVVF
jgi:hypothetical protein